MDKEAHRTKMREYQRKRSEQDGVSPALRYGEIKPCALCLTEYRGSKNSKYCSNTCSNLGRAGWTPETIDWQAFHEGKDQQRAYITRSVRVHVYERDSYVCWLCGEPCEGTGGREPRSPSLDHVLPWSVSQDDSPENLRTAHLLCNIKRGPAPN